MRRDDFHLACEGQRALESGARCFGGRSRRALGLFTSRPAAAPRSAPRRPWASPSGELSSSRSSAAVDLRFFVCARFVPRSRPAASRRDDASTASRDLMLARSCGVGRGARATSRLFRLQRNARFSEEGARRRARSKGSRRRRVDALSEAPRLLDGGSTRRATWSRGATRGVPRDLGACRAALAGLRNPPRRPGGADQERRAPTKHDSGDALVSISAGGAASNAARGGPASVGSL